MSCFPNSSIDSKFGFWNVGLGLYILPSFSQFMKEIEHCDFLIAYAALWNFSQFTKKFENWDFWSPLTLICIYVNCFNRVRFLTEVSTKLQKMHFFREFKDHNSEREHGNEASDSIFFIYFFQSNCIISEFENTENSFIECGSFIPWSMKQKHF